MLRIVLAAAMIGLVGVAAIGLIGHPRPEGRRELIDEMMRARKSNAAVTDLEAHLKRHPDDVEARGLLTQLRASRARHFDRALGLLGDYLRAHPGNDAHLLMGEFATELPEPRPELALEHLRAIRPRQGKERAVVKFYEGRAQYQRGRFDLVEAAWTEALRLDPVVPEAGWALMDLYEKEGRLAEAHALGMRLVEVEPDPVDRARLLLEVGRMDIELVSPGSQVALFGPLSREHPEDLPLALTYGLALVRDSQGDEGIRVLEAALHRHPEAPEAWDAWLTGLAEAFRFDRLSEEFARLPASMAGDPRFARHEGIVAQHARDWPRAIRAFRRATAHEPSNGNLWYRLRSVLLQGGDRDERERVNRWYTSFEEAFKRMRPTYEEALAVRTIGVEPHTELYHRLADLRERMGRPDEARAWHRIVLRTDPADAASRAALERLK